MIVACTSARPLTCICRKNIQLGVELSSDLPQRCESPWTLLYSKKSCKRICFWDLTSHIMTMDISLLQLLTWTSTYWCYRKMILFINQSEMVKVKYYLGEGQDTASSQYVYIILYIPMVQTCKLLFKFQILMRAWALCILSIFWFTDDVSYKI